MNFNLLKLLTYCVYTAGFIIQLILAGNANAGVQLDRIIAIVNDDVIMQSELLNKLRTIISQMGEKKAQLPPRDILEKQVL